MSLRRKLFSGVAVATAAITFSVAAIAQDADKTASPQKVERQRREGREFGKRKMGRDGEFGKHRGGMMRGFHDLNLTEDQKTQIKAIRESNRPDEAMLKELQSIRDARKAGTEITAEQKERLKAFRDQSQLRMKDSHEKMLNVLTAEQRTQLETRKTEMKQRMDERRQKMQERRQQRDKRPADKPAVTTDKKDN